MAESQAKQARDLLTPIQIQPPFRMWDRIVSQDESTLCAIKNVTQDEWCLIRPKDGQPFFPATMMVEMMIQTAGQLDERLHQENPSYQTIVARLQGVEIYQSLHPGDQVLISARVLKLWDQLSAYTVQASVDKAIAAKGDIYFQRLSHWPQKTKQFPAGDEAAKA